MTFVIDELNSKKLSLEEQISKKMSEMLYEEADRRGILPYKVKKHELDYIPNEIEKLLEDGADPNKPNSIGRTILHSAGALGRFKILELMIKKYGGNIY